MTELFDQSIFVRRGNQRRRERRRHRGLAHSRHDPTLSRQLAEHVHRHRFHSALDSRIALRSLSLLGYTLNVMTLWGSRARRRHSGR